MKGASDQPSLPAFAELKTASPATAALLCWSSTGPEDARDQLLQDRVKNPRLSSRPASPEDRHLLFGEPGIQGRVLCSIDGLNAAERGKKNKLMMQKATEHPRFISSA